MKKIITVSLIGMLILSAYLFNQQGNENNFIKPGFKDKNYSAQRTDGKITTAKQKPGDWFYLQRAYPNDRIPENAYIDAYQAVKQFNAQKSTAATVTDPWVEAGPTNIPGRIPCLAVHPSDLSTIYAGSAAGGVFKSTDFGVTWNSIFDDEVNLSIGAIAIHPTSPNIIFVGTGEANAANDTYEGVGIYKSTNAGATWTNVGLPDSYKIGRIVFDPRRPDTMFVAVQGKLFGVNNERGVYRSQDGGTNWSQVFAIDDTTGCIDIVVDSATGTVVASMWTRYRDREYRTVGGLNSGIYKSIDGGDNWYNVTVGLPVSADTVGRIGLTVEQTTGTMYSIYVNHPGRFMGIYKSVDLGETWSATNYGPLEDIYNGFGWYFAQLRVTPGNPNKVYALAVELYTTDDGGSNWYSLGYGTHADHHDFFIDPSNSNNIYEGSDGGVSFSSDGGINWTSLNSMPATQFYAMTIDPSNSDILYGGTQDNGSMRSVSTAVDNWEKVGGGDGFYVEVDPTDSNVFYAEYQWGQVYKIDNGSWSWAVDWTFYDLDRHNWNTPFVMDPQNNLKLYYCSDKIYQTIDGATTWTQKSDDLTNGPGTGNLTYGTITTIDVAPSDSTVIYVGTDDSNVWVTTDADNAGMFSWINISGSLPNRWVTRVSIDPANAAIAYVCLSGYKDDELIPHIYRTDNYGSSWTSISGDLPDFPVNDLIVDPDIADRLYIATDFGAFYTSDLGVTWQPLGTGLPMVAIHDIDFHAGDRKLVAGTHGRSMYSLDLSLSGCCIGLRGNVDNDITDEINIADLVYFVSYSFDTPSGPAPPCLEEADVDGSGELNIGDIVYLVDFMFNEGPFPLTCP